MSYTPNVPQIGQSLDGTRDLIRGNFQVINTTQSVNHVAFNDTGAGKHKFLQLPVGSVPTTAVDEMGIYPDNTKTFVGAATKSSVLMLDADSGSASYSSLLIPVRAAVKFSVSAGGTITSPLDYMFNISSVAVVPTSSYTINFTNNLPNTNYIVSITAVGNSLTTSSNVLVYELNVSYIKIKCVINNRTFPFSVMVQVSGG